MRPRRENKHNGRREKAQRGAESEPYLSFSVGGIGLVLPLSEVSEILACEELSPLPGAPEHVRGSLHNRGRVIPVIDISPYLKRPALALTQRTSVLLIELSGAQGRFPVGILSEGIASLLNIVPGEIEPPPALHGSAPSCLRGVYPRPERGGSLALVDFAQLLADQAADLPPPDLLPVSEAWAHVGFAAGEQAANDTREPGPASGG